MARRSRGFNTPFARLELPARRAAPPAPVPHTAEEADDGDTFAQAMSGVTPLGRDGDRIEPQKRETAGTLCANDDEAAALAELEALVNGDGTFDLEDSGEAVWGRAPGVSHELVDGMRRGQLAVRRHIDLHGLSRVEAKDALVEFITAARKNDLRCVLVVTGRGLGSPQGVSVLRQALPRWLTRAPLRAHVLAFCTAQRHDGGPGAFYVLVRRPGVRPFG
jgi:DNA-nicking Smr family endonuclease